MELVLSPGRIGGENNRNSPFQNQEVREWSHVDRLTGMLEHARIETGRWQSRHQGTAQAYGKVIDSRERNSADGNVVQKARRQVEVFQSQEIGGRSVQVVRASQWSSSRITDSTSSSPVSVSMNDVVVPQLRNGNDEFRSNCTDENSSTKLSQVSRLSRQINSGDLISVDKRTNLQNLQNYHDDEHDNNKIGSKSPLIVNRLKKFDGMSMRRDFNDQVQDRNNKLDYNKSSMTINNLKSTSNEDLTKSCAIIDSNSNSNSKSQMIMFTRDCKARRSLQIPKSMVHSDFEKYNKSDDIEIRQPRPPPPPSSSSSLFIDNKKNNLYSSRNSSSSADSDDDHLPVSKNDKTKIVKSYVLGMEKELNDDANLDSVECKSSSSSLNLPKPITDKKIIFNGTSINENGKDGNLMKSEYVRPTPILLKPKPNTTVVHLNNKLFLNPGKNVSEEKEPIPIIIEDKKLVNNSTGIRNLMENNSNNIKSRVQSLASRFSNGNNNSFGHNSGGLSSSSSSSSSSLKSKKQLIIDSSNSRIESLINRSGTILNHGVVENMIETLPTSVNGDSDDVNNGINKPIKKVGFSKTEVHFAAESGKVNIVETDCKPPPSNRFRRRRRNGVNNIANNVTSVINNKNLPVIHFGDTSYEKYIFGQSSSNNNNNNNNNETILKNISKEDDIPEIETEVITDDIEIDLSLKEKRNNTSSTSNAAGSSSNDELLLIKDGWRGKLLKTIMQSEPPSIDNEDDDNDYAADDSIINNSGNNFNYNDIDDAAETIIDHSFKGHTTTVNLGANRSAAGVITKTQHLRKRVTNEGICDNSTVTSTAAGIRQLQFINTRIENVTPISISCSTTSSATSSNNILTPCIENMENMNEEEEEKEENSMIIKEEDKISSPYSILVSNNKITTTVSKIPRPLIQTQLQSTVLKSAHLVMNLNSRIKNFNSIVKNNNGSSNYNNDNNDNNNNNNNSSSSIQTLKNLILSSLEDNNNHNCSNGMHELIHERDSNDVDIIVKNNNNNYPKLNTSTLITINSKNNSCSMNYKNSLNYPIRFTPLKLKHLNAHQHNHHSNICEEDKKLFDNKNDINVISDHEDNNQLQYSSGSEQADEEVRSYMIGRKIRHSESLYKLKNKKISNSISTITMKGMHQITSRNKNVEKSIDEILHSNSNTQKSVKELTSSRNNDDSIIDINHIENGLQRIATDEELEDIIVDSGGLPEEEICFEANRTVEKNHVIDKGQMNEELSNVVTSDNENNKVFSNVVKTHEPGSIIAARVEDSNLPAIIETRIRDHQLFGVSKKLRISKSRSSKAAGEMNKKEEKSDNIVREKDVSSNVKPFSSTNEKEKTIVKHKAKDHCDNDKSASKDHLVEKNFNFEEDDNAISDPTYVNVFKNCKKISSITPIYENFNVTRKNGDNNNSNDKKYSRNILRSELKEVVNAATNGNCESELMNTKKSNSVVNCSDEENSNNLKSSYSNKSTSRDSANANVVKHSRVSENNSNIKIIKSNNRSENNNNNRMKSGGINNKTKSKKIVRGEQLQSSNNSSIDSSIMINRNSVLNIETDGSAEKEIISVKDKLKPLHTKSTRSSRLHRVNQMEKTENNHDQTSSSAAVGKEVIIMEKYSSSCASSSKNEKKKHDNNNINNNTNELRRSNRKLSHSVLDHDASGVVIDAGKKNVNNDISTRSKKPIEIVYQTAVFNMKNEKLVNKSSKSKESKTPRYINDLICGGSKPKRSYNDHAVTRHIRGNAAASLSQQRGALLHQKSA